jgi:hypothetical protein
MDIRSDFRGKTTKIKLEQKIRKNVKQKGDCEKKLRRKKKSCGKRLTLWKGLVVR